MSESNIETKALISYWGSVLKKNRYLMGITTKHLVQQTIEKLKKLEELESKGIIICGEKEARI